MCELVCKGFETWTPLSFWLVGVRACVRWICLSTRLCEKFYYSDLDVFRLHSVKKHQKNKEYVLRNMLCAMNIPKYVSYRVFNEFPLESIV